MNWTLHCGHALEVLRTLPEASVHCIVTSPPYFGLRDYGTAKWEGGDPDCTHAGRVKPRQDTTGSGLDKGRFSDTRGTQPSKSAYAIPVREICRCGARRLDAQIGLEPTPDEFVDAVVAVFAEARRVLREDGVAWVNLGDSYANDGKWGGHTGGKHVRALHASPIGRNKRYTGLKPKDLIGVPWRVAFALQQPYYAGSIKNRDDRIWLAAMLDAEGCMFIHKRKAGQHNGQGYRRQNDSYGPGVEIANTSLAVVERIMAIVGKGSICSQGPEQTGGRRRQTIYRWNLRTIESREFVRELYPYLIAKQHQARLLYGCPTSGTDAERAHSGLMALHRGLESSVDFPAPPSLVEPGWYLRSDVIWSKANPMPESVTDRPTKAHEYVFLLTKNARYWYDVDAIREAYAPSTLKECEQDYTGEGLKDYDAAGVQNPSDVKRRIVQKMRSRSTRESVDTRGGNQATGQMPTIGSVIGRNARSVWTIPTEPSPYEHFAVMPRALARRCVVAGCPPGGVVLDPFAGMATTGVVALEEGRSFVGIELSPKYHAIARERLANVAPLLATEVPA